MRSRTELVTTTFIDSEEELTDNEDSEEDWRPSGKNGKKQKLARGGSVGGGSGSTAGNGKRGRKRKGSGSAAKLAKHRLTYKDSDDDEPSDEPSEDDLEDCDEYEVVPSVSSSQQKGSAHLPPKKQFSDKNLPADDTLELLLYKRDLIGDYAHNNRLCLWRRDDNNLLQKYIRVKTDPEEFLFTSSSVYSSWDDKRVSDFVTLEVKAMDANNRRVKAIEVEKIHELAKEEAQKKAEDQCIEDGDNEDNDDQNTESSELQESDDEFAEEAVFNSEPSTKSNQNTTVVSLENETENISDDENINEEEDSKSDESEN